MAMDNQTSDVGRGIQACEKGPYRDSVAAAREALGIRVNVDATGREACQHRRVVFGVSEPDAQKSTP